MKFDFTHLGFSKAVRHSLTMSSKDRVEWTFDGIPMYTVSTDTAQSVKERFFDAERSAKEARKLSLQKSCELTTYWK